MWKYTVEVTGMKCPKCEAKANAAIEKAFNVKKVTSSHVDNKTVIISKDDLDEAKIKKNTEVINMLNEKLNMATAAYTIEALID